MPWRVFLPVYGRGWIIGAQASMTEGPPPSPGFAGYFLRKRGKKMDRANPRDSYADSAVTCADIVT
jgi:hypothetical protein